MATQREEVAGGQSSDSGQYFNSYSDLGVHQLMLKDRPRTMAYRKFIESNRHLIKDKVVMDVGAGTGILSLFAAAAGAKKVYAVEASNVAQICKEIVSDNEFEEVIEVIHSAVEDVTLPTGVKVDLIISEWMGFYLLHESMLDSVIYARDKFLSPSGIMAPSHATLFLAPVDMTDHFQERNDEWSNIYGFDFSPVASVMNEKEVSEPLIKTLSADLLRSVPQEVSSLDLLTVTLEDVRRIVKCLKFTMNQESMVHGFAAWFNVDFKTSPRNGENDSSNEMHSASDDVVNDKGDANVCSNNDSTSNKTENSVVTLATGPEDQPTHWKQTVIFLPQTCLVEAGLEMYCVIKMVQDTGNKRHYNITLELTDGDIAHDDISQSSEGESGEDLDDSTDCPVPCDWCPKMSTDCCPGGKI